MCLHLRKHPNMSKTLTEKMRSSLEKAARWGQQDIKMIKVHVVKEGAAQKWRAASLGTAWWHTGGINQRLLPVYL